MEDLVKDLAEIVAEDNLREYRLDPIYWWLKSIIGAAVWIAALWGIVRILERAHWREIRAREAEVSHIFLSTTDDASSLPSGSTDVGQLVVGSAVMSHDAVRRLSVFFRRVFGGSIDHYERLLARTRREALNRLRAEAVACGGGQVRGIRFQTVHMSEKRPIVAVIAFGTAY